MRGKRSSDGLKALNTLRDNLPAKKKILLWGLCKETYGRGVTAKVRRFLQSPSTGSQPPRSAIGAEMLMSVAQKEREALDAIVASIQWQTNNPDRLAKARSQKQQVPNS